MRYSIQIAIKKLVYNYKKYLAITIQYALGICLIFLSLNMQFCAESELISAKSNTAINLIRIVGEMTQSDFQAAYVNVASSNHVDVIYYRDIFFQVNKDNCTHIIHAYFVDDLFYKYIVGSDAIDSLRYRPGPPLQGHQGCGARAQLPEAVAHLLQDVPRTRRRRQDVLIRRERHDIHHRHPEGGQEESREGIHRRVRVGRGAEAEGREPGGLFRFQVQLLPVRARRCQDQ